jgi:hypothetical protein
MNGRRIGISKDKEIKPFKFCNITDDHKCTPTLLGEWTKTSTRFATGASGLTSQSQIICSTNRAFGVISFVPNDDSASMSNVPKDASISASIETVEEPEPPVEEPEPVVEEPDNNTYLSEDLSPPKTEELGEKENPDEENEWFTSPPNWDIEPTND